MNHTVLEWRDNRGSAACLTGVLGLAEELPFGPFRVVGMGNGVSFDFHDSDGEISSQHDAFVVSEAQFDQIFERVCDSGQDYFWTRSCTARARSTTTTGARDVRHAP